MKNGILITKDTDFLHAFTLHKTPYKLLLVTTGNITNDELERVFKKTFHEIARLFESSSFIELSRDNIIIHE